MINRVTVTLDQGEYNSLLQIALNELRNPQDQMHYILRRELKRLGYLPATSTSPNINREAQHVHTN